MSERPQNHPAEQDPRFAGGPAYDAVKQAMQTEALAELSREQQGEIIVDTMIGALAAADDIASREPTGLRDALRAVGTAVDATATGNPWERTLGSVTRSGGLRMAVDVLARDERTKVLLSGLERRVRFDEQGNLVALTSLNQASGYLEAKAAQHPLGGTDAAIKPSWQDQIVAGLTPNMDAPFGPWNKRAEELMTPEAGVQVRQEQQDWQAAVVLAERADVDVELLARTGDELRRQAELGQFAGNVVPKPQVNYDHLFEE